MKSNFDTIFTKETIDRMPIWAAAPLEGATVRGLVVWLCGFTGRAEHNEDMLRDLASAGYATVSFDLEEHGSRTRYGETHEEMIGRVNGNRARFFWPIIGRTAEDFPRVIDWALERFGLGTDCVIAAGGISMGGDIALTASAVDPRIQAVCAAIATPDWLRPGSLDEQGTADTYSWNLYHRLNPLTNIQSYRHLPRIRFENAAADRYVPAEAARRFRELLLAQTDYGAAPERIEIVEHAGLDHGFPDEMWQNCLSWLSRLMEPASAETLA